MWTGGKPRWADAHSGLVGSDGFGLLHVSIPVRMLGEAARSLLRLASHRVSAASAEIPAQAGIQQTRRRCGILDPRLRGDFGYVWAQRIQLTDSRPGGKCLLALLSYFIITVDARFSALGRFFRRALAGHGFGE